MNKIHKVIWSRSKDAFVVVSDLVSSMSCCGARSERVAICPQDISHSGGTERAEARQSLNALLIGGVLLLGLSNPVSAQVAIDYGLGDQGTAWSAQIADWKNALTFRKLGGSGWTSLGGTFSVKPGAVQRPDGNPYAAVWVEKGTDAQDWAYLTNSTLAVEGDHLHGIYVASGARLSVGGATSVQAHGDRVTGISLQGGNDSDSGRVFLIGAAVNASGIEAKGLSLSGGLGTISDGTIISASGENAIGIDVDGGELLVLSAGATPNQISAQGIAGSDVTGIRFSSGSGHTLQGGGLMNFEIDVQGDVAGLNSTGIKIEDASLFADNKRYMYLGNSSAGDETLKRIKINVKGGEEDTSLATGIDINNEIQVHLNNAELSVDGKRAVGIKARADASLEVSGDVEIKVSGYNVYGIVLETDNTLSFAQDGLLEVAGTGEWITGIMSETGGDISLAGIGLSVESTGPVYPFGTTKGLELTGTRARITDGTKIDSKSEYLAYGIRSRDSDTFLSNVTVAAESDQTARTLFSFGDTVEIENSHLVAKAWDARAVTASSGTTLTMSRTIVAAADADSAIGIYGDDSVMRLSEVNIDVAADAIASGVIASSDSELDLLASVVNVVGGGGSTVGLSTSASSVKLENTDITVEGVGVGWKSLNDTQAQLIDSRISIRANGSLTAVDLNGTKNVQIQGSSSLLSAVGQDIEILATALQVYNGASVEVDDATLQASVLDDRSYAVGVSAWAGAGAILSRVQMDVDGGAGEAIGAQAEGVDSQIVMADSSTTVSAEKMASGLRAADAAVGELIRSTLTVDGEEAWGIGVLDASVTLKDSHLEVSAENQAIGIFAPRLGQVIMDGAQVNVVGGVQTLAAYIGDHSTLHASGGTRIQSSGVGIGIGEGAQVSLTNTEIVSLAPTFWAEQYGLDTQRIHLGTGVVAKDNNGTLLRVERDPSVQTGRVELTIADGALVAGGIVDVVSSLSDLTTDGGTFVTLSSTPYHGMVHNVRGLQATNGAHVGGGTVAAPNTVLEDVLVDKATLSGNWRIAGALQARNSSRVAPGNSIGIITTGSIDWGQGTVYEVEVNDQGHSDRIDITGPAAADISQTAIHVMQEDGVGGYRLDHDYTILTAAGGVTGEFTDAQWQGNELIRVTPSYQAGSVTVALGVDDQALGRADMTANQRATAEGALSVAGQNTAVDAAFLSLNPSGSFDALSGEIHPSTRAALLSGSTWLPNAILRRLAPTQSPQELRASSASEGYVGSPLWVTYSHNEKKAKGDTNVAERKHKTDSFALGAEAQLRSGLSLGGAFAYSNSRIKLNERRSSADIDSYSVALYAGKNWEFDQDTLHLKGGIGHTWHDISSHRSVELGGAHTLKADYDARTTQLFGELSYAKAVNEQTTVEPYLGLTWLSNRSDGFSESGGPAALKGNRATDDVAFTTLGLRAATTLEAGTTQLTLRGGAGWRRAFGDRQPGSQLSFIQGGGTAFTIVGAPIARNTAIFDLGAELRVGRGTSLGLSYEGQAGSGFNEHAASLHLKTRF